MVCVGGCPHTLTPAEVAGIVSSDVPTGSTAAEWVAKSRQESGHCPACVNEINAIGLFQIRDIHWDASFNEDGRLPGSRANYRNMLKGANFNWRQAQFLYSDARQRGGTGWEPWRASGGRPTPNAEDLAAAGAPNTSVGASGGSAGDLGEAIPGLGPLNPFDDWLDAVTSAYRWITNRDNLIRIAMGLVGGALILVGASIVARPVIEPAVAVASKGVL